MNKQNPLSMSIVKVFFYFFTILVQFSYFELAIIWVCDTGDFN